MIWSRMATDTSWYAVVFYTCSVFQQLGLDRGEDGTDIMVSYFKTFKLGWSLMPRNPDLKKVSDGPFSENQHVSVPSNTPINMEEISGCSINGRTWISMCNFAAQFIAEMVPFRLLESLKMGVNPFPLWDYSPSGTLSQYSVGILWPPAFSLSPSCYMCMCGGVRVWSCIIETIRGNDCT